MLAEAAGLERLELETGHADKTGEREGLAGWTGLEPAASGVTGRRSNQLNYHPKGLSLKVQRVKVNFPTSWLANVHSWLA
jgi:hypothetical protein